MWDKNDNCPELANQTLKSFIARLKMKSLHQLLSSLATRILRFIPLSQPNIRKRISCAHLAGYNYHQNEVRKDPKLLEWVLYEDYLDCKPDE